MRNLVLKIGLRGDIHINGKAASLGSAAHNKKEAAEAASFLRFAL